MGELFIKLEKLQNISGTNDKKKFIKENRDDQLFLDTLDFLLNPYKITNISKKKINKKVQIINNQLKDLNEFYDYLINKSSGRDKDISIIQAFIREHEEFKEQLEELACKSMRLGVQGKLVNQALGYNLIPQFNVQLASKYEDKNIKGKEFIISTKIDGVKTICIIDKNGKAKFYSRQGKEFTDLVDIEKSINKLGLKDFVFDGEIYYNGEVEDSKDGYKKTMNNISIKGEKHNLKYIVYDCLTSVDEFYNGICKLPTIDRKRKCKELLINSNGYVEYLGELYVGKDKTVIPKLLEQADKNGEEGIIVSVANAKWEGKRTKNCMKLKSFNDYDVLVTDVLLGDGKYKDVLGKIEVQFKYKGNVYTNYIGSGFLDFEREYYINHKDEIIGKVITIKAFELTENQKDGVGLRFGTWQGKEFIRLDKNGIDDTNVE